MFLWNVERCLRIFDRVYVSSDGDEILNLASGAGAIPIKRTLELCGDVPNIPVYQHAHGLMGDVAGIVAVQANSPTLQHTTISIVKELLERGLSEVMTCHQMTHGSNYHQQHNKVYGSVWGMSADRLLFYPDPFHPNPEALVVDNSIDIETKEDFDEALKQWQSIHRL
jgi:CMP-N-acetylneuraminic acid synthetase